MNVSILLVCYKLEYYSWDLGVLGIGSIVNMNVFDFSGGCCEC